jgi:hypothetical protein
MNNIKNSYFDILEFIHMDEVREITIFLNRASVTIRETRVKDTDLWIVLSNNLENALKDRFRSAYPMFFGILLTALHKHQTTMPIHGICLEDVDYYFDNKGLGWPQLAEEIATRKYQVRDTDESRRLG